MPVRAARTTSGSLLLRLLDRWAWRRYDRHASTAGWLVRVPAPLIRVYTRPHADALVTCSPCGGTGAGRRGPCLSCFGTGETTP